MQFKFKFTIFVRRKSADFNFKIIFEMNDVDENS